ELHPPYRSIPKINRSAKIIGFFRPCKKTAKFFSDSVRTALSGGIDEAETYGVRMMYLPFCQNDSLVARFVRLFCQKSFGISLVGVIVANAKLKNC
ncbi:hypothetical protein, partial [Alistipes putredinis]